MKRIAMLGAVITLALSLASPALAGHSDRYRGHGHSHKHPHGYRTAPGGSYIYYPTRPYLQGGVSVSFGSPWFGVAGIYEPAPVYYAPAPMFVPSIPCDPFWVPGYWVRDHGVRFFVSGHWSH